jgi:hypothetical protein
VEQELRGLQTLAAAAEVAVMVAAPVVLAVAVS